MAKKAKLVALRVFDCSNSGPEAITVAATDKGDRRSGFSNFGTCVDIFAPGSNITSLSHSSDTGTAGNSGTSSTPHVTGAAPLYLQGHPNASPAEVADAITGAATSGKVGNAGSGSPNKLLYTKDFGGGDPGPACSRQTNGDDVTIADNGPAATSAVTFADCGGNGSARASVEVDIKHTYRGDLAIELVAPDGTSYSMKMADAGDSAANVTVTYTVDLSAEARDGRWTLSVRDVFRFDTGIVDSWSITA